MIPIKIPPRLLGVVDCGLIEYKLRMIDLPANNKSIENIILSFSNSLAPLRAIDCFLFIYNFHLFAKCQVFFKLIPPGLSILSFII